MRLFVALDIPDTVRAALAERITPLKTSTAMKHLVPGARWVKLEGAHVTLKFIGEVPEEKLPEIKDALAQVRVEPFDLRFAGLGFFPNEQRPRVFWAGIEAGPQLPALAAAVDAALTPLGIPREERAFRPHLTLARLTSAEGVDRLRALPEIQQSCQSAAAGPIFGSTRGDEFYLYQSILKPAGAEYTRLAAYPLSGETAS